MDTESLQRKDRRRGSCLDVFLVVSIIILFVAVTAVAAGGVMVVTELRSSPPSIESSKLRGEAPSSAYKMQNFAYLEAISSELKNYTMTWASVQYSTGDSVGSNFFFDAAQHSLKLKQTGTYFMYIDLNFSCTYMCKAGLLTVHLGDKLTCKVELPEADTKPVSRKCWTVSPVDGGTRLLAQMTVPKGLENWKLELSSSGFGMFLVK